MNNQRNFRNKRLNLNQQKTLGPINQPQIISNQPQIVSNQLQQPLSDSGSSNIINIIIVLVIVIILIYVVYVYGREIYNYFNTNILSLFETNNDYYLMESEEEKKNKIKCPIGCVKGKCNKNDDKNGCKDDNECNLCIDNSGGFYGTVPKDDKKENEKLKEIEEEDIIENKRIQELEEMIKNRNKQIDDLNKYIDYLNKNKDKINKEKIKTIYEEENKNFIVKKNYS